MGFWLGKMQTSGSVIYWLLEVRYLVCSFKAERQCIAWWRLWRKNVSSANPKWNKENHTAELLRRKISVCFHWGSEDRVRAKEENGVSWAITCQRDNTHQRLSGRAIKSSIVLALKKENQCWRTMGFHLKSAIHHDQCDHCLVSISHSFSHVSYTSYTTPSWSSMLEI